MRALAGGLVSWRQSCACLRSMMADLECHSSFTFGFYSCRYWFPFWPKNYADFSKFSCIFLTMVELQTNRSSLYWQPFFRRLSDYFRIWERCLLVANCKSLWIVFCMKFSILLTQKRVYSRSLKTWEQSRSCMDFLRVLIKVCGLISLPRDSVSESYS